MEQSLVFVAKGTRGDVQPLLILAQAAAGLHAIPVWLITHAAHQVMPDDMLCYCTARASPAVTGPTAGLDTLRFRRAPHLA